MQPLVKCEIKPDVPQQTAKSGTACEFNATVSNDEKAARTVTVGYDAATLPAGWSCEITAGGKVYSDAQVDLNISAGEQTVVKYSVTPSDARIIYLKTFAYCDSKYSDIHYIKITSSLPAPEFLPALSMLVIVPLVAVVVRKTHPFKTE